MREGGRARAGSCRDIEGETKARAGKMCSKESNARGEQL